MREPHAPPIPQDRSSNSDLNETLIVTLVGGVVGENN